jgi:hypothetical protein
MTEHDIERVIDDLRHCDGRHRNIGVYTFDNAIEAIEQLRKERDEAIRQRDEARRERDDAKHNLAGVMLTIKNREFEVECIRKFHADWARNA